MASRIGTTTRPDAGAERGRIGDEVGQCRGPRQLLEDTTVLLHDELRVRQVPVAALPPETDVRQEQEGLAIELGGAHRAPTGQGVIGGQGDREILHHEPGGSDRRQGVGPQGDREVDVPGDDARLDVRFREHLRGEHRLREAFHDERGQAPQRGRRDRADAQRLGAAGRLVEGVAHEALVAQDLPGMFECDPTRLVHLETPADPIEQGLAELGLKTTQRAAQRRLVCTVRAAALMVPAFAIASSCRSCSRSIAPASRSCIRCINGSDIGILSAPRSDEDL